MTSDGAKIGPRIREIREQRSLTLGALAERAAVSKGYLSQLENGGASNPSIETLGKIADALDVSLQELVGEPVASPPNSGRLSRGLREFIERREAQSKPLPPEDVEMLRTVSYRRDQLRRRRPMTADDLEFFYRAIIE